MPTKIHLNGRCVSYELSDYQRRPKKNLNTHLNEENPQPQKKRMYCIDSKARNRILNSALMVGYSQRERGEALCFGTFTYTPKQGLAENNKEISKFFKNLQRSEAECRGYLWTKEFTPINGYIHYHALFTCVVPKGIATYLNEKWCDARGYYSPNAFRTEPKNGLIVKNAITAAAYCAKYMSKDKCLTEFDSRAYAISNGWQCPELKYSLERHPEMYSYIQQNIVPLHKNTTNTVIETEYADIFNISQSAAKKIYRSVIDFSDIL